MQRSSIVRIVDSCVRHAVWVIVLITALAAGSAVYAVRHFAIKTDVNDLFPADLPWTRRALEFMRTFPQPDILVVVDAPAPELVEAASNKLAQALATRSDLLRGIHQLDSGPFFEQNGLLFLPTEVVTRITGGLASFGLMGVAGGMIKLGDLAWPMTRAADTAEEVLSGRQLFLARARQRRAAGAARTASAHRS
jgi:hypothetical protein